MNKREALARLDQDKGRGLEVVEHNQAPDHQQSPKD